MRTPWLIATVICITVFASGVFAYTLIHSAFLSPSEEVTADSGLPAPHADATTSVPSIATVAAADSSAPQMLRIPKIGVSANITPVGLGKTGNMAVPLTYTDVGWYRYGTLPGQLGSAVIDGHVNNGFGLSAVFVDLNKVAVGDDIFVDDQNGKPLRFSVDEIETYNVADVPREKIFNRKDAERLVLITCDGTWLKDEKMYDERLVVYAHLVS